MAAIAVTLGVHRSTLYPELELNTGLRDTRFSSFMKWSLREKCSASSSLKMTLELSLLMEDSQRLQLSSEQILGWIKRHNGNEAVSYKSIYTYI